MEDLIRHAEQINRQLARHGVKFGIYKNGTFEERLFPFDAIPRVISAQEWEVLSRGLTQRVRALNLFLRDIYGEKRILADGVVPEEFVYRSPGYLAQCEGIVPPGGVYSHISGIDLVKGKDGVWYVLEDNLRIPSGASYPLIARGLCRRLGVENVYSDAGDFCRRYLFDASQPCSVRASMDALLGNGMVLRETISTPTLAYLQMAESAMEMASRSEAPAVELQWVLDDIMAFRGSFDDAVDHEGVRNIAKTGGTVERVSLMLRMEWQLERLRQEMRKLLNRLYKTDLPTQPQALQVITAYALENQEVPVPELLGCVEGLFVV